MRDLSKVKVGDLVIVHTWIGSFRPIHHYFENKVTKVEKYPNKKFSFDGFLYGRDSFDNCEVLLYDKDFLEQKNKEERDENRKRELLHNIKKSIF